MGAFALSPVFLNGAWAEQIGSAALDRECDQRVDDLTEGFIVGQSLLEFGDAIGTDETADWLAAIDIGELVVGAVPLRVFRFHAATGGVSADLVLA